MKKLFFLLTVLGLLCAACGGNAPQNKDHTHADGTTHIHEGGEDHNHDHDHTAAEQEHFKVDDQGVEHLHEVDHNHDHEHGEEPHSHDDHQRHTH